MADNYYHMTDDGNQIGIDENLETEYKTDNIQDSEYKLVAFKDTIYQFSNYDSQDNWRKMNQLISNILQYYPKLEEYLEGVEEIDDLILYINDLPYVITGEVNDRTLYVNDNAFFDSRMSGELNKLTKVNLFDKIVYGGKVVYDKLKNKDNTLPTDKLYHGTIVKYALNIFQKGLRANPSNSSFNGVVHKDTVFLATNYKTAESYSSRVNQKFNDGTINTEPIVIEFDLNKMDSNKIVFDYDLHNNYTNRNDAIYNQVAHYYNNNNGNKLNNPNASIDDNSNPLKFGKIGYRGIAMPSAITSVTLPLRKKTFNNINSFISFVNKQVSLENGATINNTNESVLNQKKSALNEGYYLQDWQRNIIQSLPEQVVLYHSTKPEAMEDILAYGEFKHGLGDERDSNNIWFSIERQNNFGNCLFGILVPKQDFENITFRFMNNSHVCYLDFQDLPLDKYPYKIISYKGYNIQNLVNNAKGDFDKFVDILYTLYDKEDDYIMIQNLMEEFMGGKYTDNKIMNESIERNGKVFYITESQVKKLILENRESKNINLARKYVISKGYSQEQAQQIIDGIRTEIPNSRIAQCKFLLGVTRMYLSGELNDQSSIANLNKVLYYIGSDAHVNEYDNNLNNEYAQPLIQRFAKNIENDLKGDKEALSSQQYQVNNDYQIVSITSFEEASQYGGYTTWCVTHQREMYDAYTHNGLGKFYFCLRNGFENEPEEVGTNAPLDSYGLSMIAISVNDDGSLNTCTCRWNHANGGNDNIMNTQQISQLFGVNFYNTFLPISEEEKQEVLNKIQNEYYDALDKYNKTGSLDSFAYWSDISDKVYTVSIKDEGDIALLVDEGDNNGAYFFPYNEEGSITFFKDFSRVNRTYLSLIETNGKCYVIDCWNLYKVMDLPNNYMIENLSYNLPSDFPNQFVRLVNKNTNTFQIFNMNNKVASDFELPNRNANITEVSQPNTLKIQISSYNDKTNSVQVEKSFYYDYIQNKVIDVQENTYEIATNKRIAYYEDKYAIVINEQGKYNLLVKDKQRVAFDIWFDDIYQLSENRNLIVVKIKSDGYNVINLLDSPYEFMFPKNFIQYHILDDNRQTLMVIILKNNTVAGLDLDTMHYEVYGDNNNQQAQQTNNESIIRENIELEVSPEEIDTTTVDKKEILNPKLWDSNKHLNSKVRLKLLDIADKFWFDLDLNWVEPKDIIITGSICNYNWNDYSDIDLHILIDYNDIDENQELVKEFCDSVKNEWNEQHINLSIYGFPVEIYIQDINEPHASSGIYSLEKNKWLKEPSSDNIQPIDGREDEIKEKSAMLMTIADNIENYVIAYKNDSAKMSKISKYINAYISKLRKMRKKALDSNGEMSSGNLIYKLMRQNGYIDKIYKLKYIVFDYLNSLN